MAEATDEKPAEEIVQLLAVHFFEYSQGCGVERLVFAGVQREEVVN